MYRQGRYKKRNTVVVGAMQLTSIYEVPDADQILYSLLRERPPEAAISHKEMPTFEENVEFIDSIPYKAWYFIKNDRNTIVGTVYLTRDNEVGLFVFKKHHRHGYGREAVELLRMIHRCPLFADIAPKDTKSKAFFETMGFKPIQIVYLLD